MLKSMSTSMFLTGVAAIIFGLVALAWPGVTVLALVTLFAVYAFIAAVLQAMRAFNSRQAGPVLGHLLLAIVDVVAGVIAISWPAPTALTLVLVIGFWAAVAGFAEIFAAFRAGETAGTRVMFLLGGAVSVVFGLLLFGRPGVGAYTLALLFGLFALIYGISQISMGVELRRAAH